MFPPDFKEFIKLLIERKVEYLIVGGYAVGYYGHPRYTGDLDIWLNRTEKNTEKIIKCLNDFGFGSLNISSTDLLKDNNIIQLGYPPLRIDLLTNIDGVDFKEAFKNKWEADIDNLKINFIHISDLIKNKRSTGRPIDIDDINNLKDPEN